MSLLAFPALAPEVACSVPVSLGMRHLAPQGISEQWLLRDCGDQHWNLIATTMGQDQAVFTDAEGRAIYAAFCATSLSLRQPTSPLLGQEGVLQSNLYAVGTSQIGSHHQFWMSGVLQAELLMISTFVGHDASGSNHRILRRLPQRGAPLPVAPTSLSALAETARMQARTLRDRTSRLPSHLTVTPCPTLDFNAVGLLYFPTYSRLAEMADWSFGRPAAPLARREVVYLGNLDPGENVSVHQAEAGLDLTRPDGRIIGRVLTFRH